MSRFWPLVVYTIYFAGFAAHTTSVIVLCIAFGLLNMLLGLA